MRERQRRMERRRDGKRGRGRQKEIGEIWRAKTIDWGRQMYMYACIYMCVVGRQAGRKVGRKVSETRVCVCVCVCVVGKIDRQIHAEMSSNLVWLSPQQILRCVGRRHVWGCCRYSCSQWW